MLVMHHHTCQVYLRTFQLIFQNFYKFYKIYKFAEIREIDPSRQDVVAADPAVMKMFTRTNGAIDGNRHFKKNFFSDRVKEDSIKVGAGTNCSVGIDRNAQTERERDSHFELFT